ncbi:cyclin-J18 isoform X2 [Cryptomeria japonica]|uniref:cyclin-J18 isoform X2 n=1 Tax=Cryptomeria japonica TaxID=3369 RepID=UPI0027DA9FBE|nr:cyclin-J18 isoform X2 [Cryptomeria japonica]
MQRSNSQGLIVRRKKEQVMASPPSSYRRAALAFLIHITQELRSRPLTKYTALCFFGDRFLRALPARGRAWENDREIRWIEPCKESNLQLFALISVWIASKIHETRPIYVGSLKSISDELITEQHFTIRDFIEATIHFNLRTGNIIFMCLEDLLIQFRNTAVSAKDLKSSVCLDVLDIMYESEDLCSTFLSTDIVAAAAILVVAYILTVPRGRSEFPMIPWLKIVCRCEEEDIETLCERILMSILQTPT